MATTRATKHTAPLKDGKRFQDSLGKVKLSQHTIDHRLITLFPISVYISFVKVSSHNN